MLHSKGQNQCPHCQKGTTPKSQQLTPAQVQLLEFADSLDGPDLVKSLQLVHDMALYHSQYPIDEDEKSALHSTKLLWECIAEICKGG